MSTVATLGVDIEASTRGFKDAMQDVQSTTRKAAETMGRMGRTLSTAVTLPLVGVGAAAIKTASDIEEMQSKFGVVFGDLADEAEAWADSTADSVSRSTYTLQGFLAQIQDTFVPLGFARDAAFEMSKTVTQLAVDLASFNNMAEGEVLGALQSALVGNSEAVRQFGVTLTQAALDAELLDMGIAGGVSSATEQQKVLARLNLILAGTADAQGDAARTADSFSNQMKALKGDMQELLKVVGEDLMPIVKEVIGQVKTAAETFNGLDEETKANITSFGLWAAAIGPVLIGLSSLLTVLGKVGGAVKWIAGVVGGMKSLAVILSVIAGTAITDALGITDIATASATATTQAGELAEALAEAGAAGDMEDLASAQDDIQGAIRSTSDEYRENESIIEDLYDTAEGLSGQAAAQVYDQISAREDLRSVYQEELTRLGQLAVQADTLAGAWTRVGDAQDAATTPGGEGENNTLTTLQEMEKEVGRLEDAMQMMDPASTAFDHAARRVRHLEEAMEDARDTAGQVAIEMSRVDPATSGGGLGGDLFETTRGEEDTGTGLQTDEDGTPQRFGLSEGTEGLREDFKERQEVYRQGMEGVRIIAQQKVTAIAQTVTSGMADAAAGFLEGIGRMAAGKATLGNVMESVLDTLLSLAQRVGKIAIGVGLAVEGIRKALSSLNPVVAIAAGAALIAVAGAARAALAGSADKRGSGGATDIRSPRGRQQQELIAKVQGRELLFLLREEEAAFGR